MKMMKRGLSLLLALVLVAGYMPVWAEAVIYNSFSADGFTFTISEMIVNGEPRTDFSVTLNGTPKVKNNGNGNYELTFVGIFECGAGSEGNYGFANYTANNPLKKTFIWGNCTKSDERATIGFTYGSVSLTLKVTGNAQASHTLQDVTVKNPTCSAEGEKKTVCKNCAHVQSTDAIPVDASAHKYVWTNDGANHTGVCEHNSAHTISGICAGGTATCAAKAVCDTCKLAYGSTVDHSWTQWTYDSSAYPNIGHYRICTVCNPQGNKYTAPGYEFAFHDYKNATCTKQGECECGSKGDYAAHSVTYTQKDDTTIKQGCENCSFEATVSLAVDDSVSRVYTGEEIKALKPMASSNWQGAAPEITYTKNVEVGTATGTIALGDASISKMFEITAADMVLDVKDYEGTYDGAEHGISIVGAPDGAKITYRETENISYGDTEITLKNAGTKKVYYKVSAPNYNDVEGNANITITKREVTVTAEDMRIGYGDAAPELSDFNYKFENIVTGENPTEVLGGGPVLSCEYKQNDPLGEYEIIVDISAMKPEEVNPSNYTVKTVDGKLTVEPRELEIEWGETEFTYDGESHVPTATVKNAVGEDEITLSITGAKTNANTESVPKYTATIEGFSVKGGNKANYKLPEENTKEFEIKAAAQEAPAELEAEKETILKKGDGKITGVTTAMEYRKEGETAYTAVSGTTITNLTSGKYFVRYKAKTNYAASPDTEVTVEAEKSLKVTVPATQEGYTLTADKTAYGYNDNPVLTLTVAEGYTMTANFVMTVTIGEDEIEVKEANLTYDSTAKKYTYTITDLQKDAAVTVEGIEDNEVPEIKVVLSKGTEDTKDDEIFTTLNKDEKLEGWWKKGTNVTATETTTGGSDVTILYLEREVEIDEAELKTKKNEEWDIYTGAITPNETSLNKIFYFKAVDASGNESEYVSTKFFQYDGKAPTFSLTEGTYNITKRTTVRDDYQLDIIKINGKDPDKAVNSRPAIAYKLEAGDDSALSYKIVATDKAGNTSEITYTINPMKFLETSKSWSKGSKKTLDFKVNSVLDSVDTETYKMKFQVKIDGKEIDAKYYTVETDEDGSGTFIKLKADYLNLSTVKVKEHTIQVSVVDTSKALYDSTETVKFTVSDNPKTGDGMNMALWGGMAVLSLMAAAVLVLGKKRLDMK